MRIYPANHLNSRRLRYGWRLSVSGHIIVDAEQRAVIYRILVLRTALFTLQAICDLLEAEHRPPPRGDVWYCTTVKKIAEQNNGLCILLAQRHHHHHHHHLGSDSKTASASQVAELPRSVTVPKVCRTPRKLHHAPTKHRAT
jgi:hypothetical protein